MNGIGFHQKTTILDIPFPIDLASHLEDPDIDSTGVSRLPRDARSGSSLEIGPATRVLGMAAKRAML